VNVAKAASFLGTARGIVPRVKVQYNPPPSKICEADPIAARIRQAEDRSYVTGI